MTASIRVLGHIRAAVRCQTPDGSRSRWIMLAGSLIGDVLVVRWVSTARGEPPARVKAVSALDAAAWGAIQGPDAFASDDAILPNAVPATLASTFWATSPGRAVPAVNTTAHWPPASTRDIALLARNTLLPGLAPGIGAFVARKAVGKPTSVILNIPGLATSVLTAIGTRYREHAHRLSRDEWSQRARRGVDHERTAALIEMVTASNPGHEFKKTLFVLGQLGDPACLDEAKRQYARPARTISSASEGQTLRQIARNCPIEPANMQRLWLSSTEAVEVRRWMVSVWENTTETEAALVMRVTQPGPRSVRIELLGQALELRQSAPIVRQLLYPTAPAFGLSAWFCLTQALPFVARPPRSVIAITTAINGAAAARFWNRPPETERDFQTLAAVALTTTAIGCASTELPSTQHHGKDGRPAFPATLPMQGALMVLSAHWSRLTRGQRLIAPAMIATWLVLAIRRHGDDRAAVVGELCYVVAPAAAAWKVSDRLDHEADYLQSKLSNEFQNTVEGARREAIRVELDEYQRLVEMARSALARITDIDDVTRVELEADCARAASWIQSELVS